MSEAVSHDEGHKVAWSCRDCGHILSTTSETAPTGRCPECKRDPGHFISAAISKEPIDAGLPSVSDGQRDEIPENDSAGLFATSPAGKEGEDINPELRVRY